LGHNLARDAPLCVEPINFLNVMTNVMKEGYETVQDHGDVQEDTSMQGRMSVRERIELDTTAETSRGKEGVSKHKKEYCRNVWKRMASGGRRAWMTSSPYHGVDWVTRSGNRGKWERKLKITHKAKYHRARRGAASTTQSEDEQ
jgi:hypothetical protein